MTRPILAGADGTDSGLDAVAFGARLAAAVHSPLAVVCVSPEQAGLAGAEAEDDVRRHAAAILGAARAVATEVAGSPPAEERTVVATSPARGLAELAEEEEVEAIVVGSTNRGAVGRVMSGSTAERLLHGTGCPVAVAPRGYRRHRREAVQPDASVVPEEVRKAARDALDAAVAGLPGGVQTTGELLFGEVVDELAMAADRGVDLLVCGSRGYGPVRRVLLGTVSSALVRQASVPTLVVPRAETG
jgi:nucleotide-binding universal stress UspA family protein